MLFSHFKKSTFDLGLKAEVGKANGICLRSFEDFQGGCSELGNVLRLAPATSKNTVKNTLEMFRGKQTWIHLPKKHLGFHVWLHAQLMGTLRGANLLPRNQPETSRGTRHQGMSLWHLIHLSERYNQVEPVTWNGQESVSPYSKDTHLQTFRG